MSLPRSLFCFVAVLSGAAAVACDNPLALPPARFANEIDTTTIHALRGTPIALPSAFDIVANTPARTDRAEPFDFAFDIDSGGNALLKPAGALGLTNEPGILVSSDPFDSIVTAPLDGYVIDSEVPVRVGTVFIARSRTESCSRTVALPRYGKFRVLELDLQERALTLQKLVNTNCGFRSLVPGTPTS
ncbi:MAG: hypothetical protein V3T28_11620 [Gemmatimonadales bacterium]